MAKYILGGVGVAKVFKQGYTDYIISSKTLTESSMSFSLSEEEVRGGLGNALIGSYIHDTGLAVTMQDALFSLEYLAMNVGGKITNSADVFTTEQVTVTGGKVTVSDTPVAVFGGHDAIYGWVKTPAEAEEDYKRVEFNGKEATVSYENGTVVCVTYCKTDNSARQFTVASNFVPDQVSLLLTLPLFKAATEKTQTLTNSSKIGEVQIKIPNFRFDGAQDLSLSASGVATSSLSGKALVTFAGNEGCDDEGYYGVITEVVYNKGEWDDVKSIVVENADLDMAVGDTETLRVLAIYSGNTLPRQIENSKLTFTSSDANVASVTTGGVVTALASGTANIEVVVTDKAGLSSYAVATVE